MHTAVWQARPGLFKTATVRAHPGTTDLHYGQACAGSAGATSAAQSVGQPHVGAALDAGPTIAAIPPFNSSVFPKALFCALTFGLDGSLTFSLPALSTLYLNSQTEQQGVLQHAPPDSLPGLVHSAARLHMLQVLRAGWHTHFIWCVSCDASSKTKLVSHALAKETPLRSDAAAVSRSDTRPKLAKCRTPLGSAAACAGAQLRGYGQRAAGAGVQHTAAVRGRLRG